VTIYKHIQRLTTAWRKGSGMHSCRTHVTTLFIFLFGSSQIMGQDSFPQIVTPNPPYPDVTEMIGESFEDFETGTMAGGWDALRHRMRGNIYLSNPGRLDRPRLTQFERLTLGDSEEVAAVNREIIEYCRIKQSAIEEAWADPKRRHPAKEVCAYQTELIPLAILTLRIGERLIPEAHQAIKNLIIAFRPEAADIEPTLWMHAPGYNGSNAHDYLSFLALSWEVTGNPDLRDAAYWGLRGELDHINLSGDISEFNVLEGHWCSSNGYDAIKAFVRDPELARMARMIAERLWLNRFLTWSPVVERITGPGSRMAPGAWLGTSGDRLQFATGVEKPIWLNEFFDWGVWKQPVNGGRWPLDDVQGMVPELPGYLQDVAWRKKYPNTLRSSVYLVPWMHRYPKLPGISNTTPDPVYGEMVNHQTSNYTLGSINHPYEATECMVYASAWWNHEQAIPEAPLGSPKRFSVLYPHYIFNGAAFMDRTEIHFQNHPDHPKTDEWTREPGPWMREFVEQGRAGLLQHKNTMIFTYSGRNRGHNDVPVVSEKLKRVSAGMFLFRWEPGLDGLFVNDKPVTSLPVELEPGDWWFIHDGDTFAGIRPLSSTHLGGDCKTTLEQRTRQIALYQDNFNGNSIEGIPDEAWVKARSGFIVELGDVEEYGSFEKFRDLMLMSKVEEEAEGFIRHVQYQRPGRKLELMWHCYNETYLTRKVNDVDQRDTRYLQSPEFAVGQGTLETHDARLQSDEDKTVWLLSAEPSQTYVAYQPNPHEQLPIQLKTPIANIQADRFPFGKLVVSKVSDEEIHLEIDAGFRPFWSNVRWRAQVWQDLGTHPSDIWIESDIRKVTANINGDDMPVVRAENPDKTTWLLDPYAKLPRVKDRLAPPGSQRIETPSNK
jgi:hypothetical protein